MPSKILSALVAVAAISLMACAGNKLTPADETSLGGLAAQVALCNTQPDPVACKQKVKAAFDAQEAKQFDGGYVAPVLEGGAL